MKTLYLHIGTPKTATTAIQHFCWDNQEVLNKKGYCYPLFEYQYTNVQKYRNAHFLVGRIRDEENRREYDKEQAIVAEGIEKILELFEQHDNIVLSDEGIWNRGLLKDTNCWERVQNGLIRKDVVVKVVVYLRKQDDFLFSWWNQQVKEGMVKSSVLAWEEVSTKLPYIQLDYYDVLEKIAGYVGKENITVRIFDKKSFFGGSIYADFLNAIHLDYTDEYQILTPFRNQSLTRNNIELKRILNQIPDLGKQENAYFRRVLTELSEKAQEDKKTSMFSKEEAESFMEKYKEGNHKIAEEYLKKSGDLFDCTYQAEDKWNLDNDQMVRDIITFFGTITLHLMRENAQLKEDLKVQKNRINKIINTMKHPMKAALEKVRKTGKD